MSFRDLEERLLSYLKDNPGSSPREIADALGEPLTRIRIALARLRDQGLVARGEEGKYYVVSGALQGIARRDVRRKTSYRLEPDIGTLLDLVENLIARTTALEEKVKRVEERLRELEELCGEQRALK